MKSICVYCSSKDLDSINLDELFPDCNIVLYPEYGLTFEEQRTLPKYEGAIVVTTSLTIVSLYKLHEIFKVVNGVLEVVYVNLHGASIEIIAKVLNENTKSTMNETIIKSITDKLKIDKQEAIKHLNELGDSMEKVYLIKTLEKE